MTKTQKEAVLLVLAVVVVALLIAFGPLALIWSLNTLFPALAIPYTFWSWLAVVVLSGAFKTTVNVNK